MKQCINDDINDNDNDKSNDNGMVIMISCLGMQSHSSDEAITSEFLDVDLVEPSKVVTLNYWVGLQTKKETIKTTRRRTETKYIQIGKVEFIELIYMYIYIYIYIYIYLYI